MASAPSNNNNGMGNPYLAMREAKIARNEKRLRELGLSTPPQPKAIAPRTSGRRDTPKGECLATYAPTRRSRRISLQTGQPKEVNEVHKRKAEMAFRNDTTEAPDGSDGGAIVSGGDPRVGAEPRGRTRHRQADPVPSSRFRVIRSSSIEKGNDKLPLSPAPGSALDGAYASIAKPPAKPKASPAAPAENSVRSIDLDIEALLLGKVNTEGILGKYMEHTGKEYVINESFLRAAAMADQQRLEHTRLSYNKYCGVQDWKNAIFLWVNLGTNDSPNEFLDNSRQVTWFGGSRMHDGSPVILKLLKYGQAVAKKQGDNDVDGSENIVLWCRRYLPATKQFTPYVCFGRMGYRSHVPGSQPLSFVWDLLDYDRIKSHQDPVVRETFDTLTK